MAEIDFFAASADLEDIASIFASGYQCRFEPDGTVVGSPKPIRSSADLVQCVEQSSFGARFAVVSPIWERFPVSRKEYTDAEGSRKSWISFRYGGPAIDLSARLPERRDGMWLLIPTHVSDYPTYYPSSADGSRDSGPEFARPQLLADAMATVRKRIRSLGVRTQAPKLKRPGPWVLPGALALHKQGLRLRIGDHEFGPRHD